MTNGTVDGLTTPKPIDQQGPQEASSSLWQRYLARLDALPKHFFSRPNQMGLDGAFGMLSLYLAYQLRFDFNVPVEHAPVLWASVPLFGLLRPAMIWALGGYRRIWRYFDLRDAANLALHALPVSGLMLLVRFDLLHFGWLGRIPITVILIDLLLFLGIVSGVRVLRRVSFEAASPPSGKRLKALIIGDEDSLPAALRQVRGSSHFEIAGLLAPESHLHGLRIGGFPVMGAPAALPRLLAAGAANLVLIADAGLECVAETVATATDFGADLRLLPSAGNIIRGEVRVWANPQPEKAFAEHSAALGQPHPAVIEAFCRRTVLITGAGGSIGAEISRQVAWLGPGTLVLLDQDENSVFEIHSQLTAADAAVPVVPVVGDIRDHTQMRSLFECYRPALILHAAAYKHVPLMESNPCEAVLNNVIGTREVARLAAEFGAERFLMISTDKAVRPTSVMGASKRLAEMVVQELAAQNRHTTRFACVRFGNVVGSRGSVVPIFLRQIAQGGPVTITDAEMTRYFMTIPEAVQLVLQAATLGSQGEVYVLNMGDPVKITTLARKLIEMSGLRPEIDIEIRIVGRRPGEKLTEKLWLADANISNSAFPRVFAVRAEPVQPDFAQAIQALENAARSRSEQEVLERLLAQPIGFQRGDSSAA